MRRTSPAEELRGPRGRRFAAVAVAAAAAIVLFALTLVFASASGATRVAENARALHWANATAGSAAVARAAVAQALVFAIDNQLGVASDDALDRAVAEATANLDEVERWTGLRTSSVLGNVDGLVGALDEFISSGREIVGLLEAGDVAAADRLHRNTFEPAHAKAAELLIIQQDVVSDSIAASEDLAGRIGDVARLLITLLIPAAAILLYWYLARRQYREAEVRMDAKLTAERQLNRAKDEFIAGISHELRTPLTSIYGFSEYLIENGIIDPREALELIALINRDSAELSRMVEDLLAAARLDSDALGFEIEPVDFDAELRGVAAPLERAGNDVIIDGSGAKVLADQARLRQVLRNLISNAVKHGGPSVRVTLDVREDHLVCTVADNGAGVPPHIEERLFDRFVHEGDDSLLAGSVGLGLSIVHSLVNRMDGEISYVRALGWTNFVLKRPLAEDPALVIDVDTAAQPLTVGTAGSTESTVRDVVSINALAAAIDADDTASGSRKDYTVRFDCWTDDCSGDVCSIW